mgnify:CR=1 FL=1
MTAVILIGIAVLCIVFGPLAGIWALNTLFGLTIAYTFKTWLAALVLAGIVGGTSKASSK